MNNTQQLYTSEDVAKILRVSVNTVWDKCRTLQWPHMRIGRNYRFAESDLLEIQEILRPKIVRPIRPGKRFPLI